MNNLKLLALDHEDLDVMSAYVQDAVAQIGDVHWRPSEKRFLIAMNRFAWEVEGTGKRKKSFERRRSALHFNRVNTVRSQGVRQDIKDAVLELLTIRFEETESPAGTVTLKFAAGVQIHLEVECLEAQLTDLGGAWTTEFKPEHDLSDS
ncbi:MAG: DUF2948 family protein [Stappiaceae bacterium]